MKNALELMQMLMDRLSPPTGQRHSLTLADDGKRLELSLFVNGRVHMFLLDDADLCKEMEVLVEEVLNCYVAAIEEDRTTG